MPGSHAVSVPAAAPPFVSLATPPGRPFRARAQHVPDPRQQQVGREREEEGEQEPVAVAHRLRSEPADPACDRARQREHRRQQRVLGRGALLLHDRHQEGEERRGAEPAGERFRRARRVENRLVLDGICGAGRRERNDAGGDPIAEVRHRLREAEDPQRAEDADAVGDPAAGDAAGDRQHSPMLTETSPICAAVKPASTQNGFTMKPIAASAQLEDQDEQQHRQDPGRGSSSISAPNIGPRVSGSAQRRCGARRTALRPGHGRERDKARHARRRRSPRSPARATTSASCRRPATRRRARMPRPPRARTASARARRARSRSRALAHAIVRSRGAARQAAAEREEHRRPQARTRRASRDPIRGHQHERPTRACRRDTGRCGCRWRARARRWSRNSIV